VKIWWVEPGMATRNFRLEFIREHVFETGEEVARISKGYDHGAAMEQIDIIFRAKDDGKHYVFDYEYNGDHGIDNFDGEDDDFLVVCYEVEKKVVKKETWKRV